MDTLRNFPNLPSFSTLNDILPEYIHTQLPLAVGVVSFLLIVVIIVYKKWKRKPEEQKNKKTNASVEKISPGIPKPTKKQELVGSKKSEVKKEEKKWKKPVGIKTSIDASIPSPTDSKLKLHEQNTSMIKKIPNINNKTQEESRIVALSALKSEENEAFKDEVKITEEKEKASWATKTETGKEYALHKRQLIIRPERDEKQEAEDFEKELKETERQAEEEAIRFMKPINLNIDKGARSKVESKKIKDKELCLVKKMCGEFRDVAKLDGNEEKEEKRKEMDKVRSARSYFKTVDKFRSESMSAVPRMKIRNEEDYFSNGSQMRLSQFEPGKISSKFTNIFSGDDSTDCEEKRPPPKKKLITLDQVLKKDVGDDEEIQTDRERELHELREARKNWVPTEEKEEEKEKSDSFSKPKIASLRNRWNPVNSDRQEKTRSLEVPQKLNTKDVFVNDSKADTKDHKMEVEKELNEIREARPTPLAKRWKPKQYQKPAERSKSAHVLQRAKLADNSWVVEKSESRMEEEKRKAMQELEFVKKVRMESLEVIEDKKIERSSSRQGMQSRLDTQKELELVKKVRSEAPIKLALDENVKEKQNTEKMEKTKLTNNDHMFENSDVKCVRFDETKREREISVEKDTKKENTKLENKVKTKLKQMKQQTEQEVSKLTNMKSKQYQNIENEKDGASMGKKPEEESENSTGSAGTRSRSLSRIRTAGLKVKDLTNEKLKKLIKTRENKSVTN